MPIAALGLLAACGSDPAAEQGLSVLTDLGTGLDAIDFTLDTSGRGAADIIADVTGGGDTTPANCPGGPGCVCTEPQDCDAALCIDFPDGKRCAAPCVDGCAGDGALQCKAITTAGGDVTNVCVPVFLHACDPCDERTDCATLGLGDKDIVCADHGPAKGGFCATTCVATADCPTGTQCADVTTREGVGGTAQQAKACVPNSDATGTPGACTCSARAISTQKKTQCSHTTVVDGKPVQCNGVRTCTTTGIGPCNATPAGAESCDGEDNDCDGETDEGLCDDSNPCTTDACSPPLAGGKIGCSHVKKTGACDADGSVCTEDDQCVAGVCTAGAAKVCGDGNSCTTSTCDPKKGCVVTPDNGKPCDDGNPCTTGEVCKAGACDGLGANVKACPSTNACQLGQCDQSTGSCKFINKPDGASCDDGDACTTADACTNTFCLGKSVTCDDANSCTTDGCKKGVGCAFAAKAGACNDGDPCTLVDSCTAGSCKGAGAKSCDDDNPCTTDVCAPGKGCNHKSNSAACDDGNSCTKNDHCSAGSCQGTQTCPLCPKKTDAECASADDGNPCNGTIYCDTALVPAQCKPKPGSAVSCDKTGNTACVANTCNPKLGTCTGLVPIAQGKSCDDGDACTEGDACKNGSCVGGPLGGGTGKICDDNNPCTSDSCSPKTGCSNKPTPGACDDGDPCSLQDACTAGVCKGGKAKVCDDKNVCTSNSCKAGVGCVAVNSDGTPCSDGDACTTKDACSQGSCAGTSVSCDDNKPCTVDTCAAAQGCQHKSSTAPCDDGNACTTGDTCAAGGCAPGKTKTCDDANVCTTDSCNPKTGCANLAKLGACDDGNACTKNDACQGGKCQGVGQKCDDGKLCTDDTCALQGGCKFTPNTKPCEDGKPCTQGDTCSGGSCAAGATKNCSSSNGACTTGVCQAGSCVGSPKSGSCDDGDACTTGDQCSGTSCKGGGAKNCNDNNSCTNDACSASSGCVHTANAQSCSDNNACTQGDKCSGGSCQSGQQKSCSYYNGACTKGICQSGNCVKINLSVSCSDNNACTQGDKCSGGSCQGGAQKNCNDNNSCTIDYCSGGSCKHGASGGSCSDGNSCTVSDYCSGGSCHAGSKKTCNDNNPCTKEGCYNGSCKVTSYVSKGAYCGSGKVCNGSGKCGSSCPTICASKCGSVSGCYCGGCQTFIDASKAKMYSGWSQVSLKGSCTSYKSDGWKSGKSANGINIRWAWAASCSVPSSNNPLSYAGENARWPIYVSKSGNYRVEVKVPNTGYVCTVNGKSPSLRYASSVYYGLVRAGQTGRIYGPKSPTYSKGGWLKLTSSVYFKKGTQTLVLYDHGSTASKCASPTDPTVTKWVFVDSVRVTLLP